MPERVIPGPLARVIARVWSGWQTAVADGDPQSAQLRKAEYDALQTVTRQAQSSDSAKLTALVAELDRALAGMVDGLRHLDDPDDDAFTAACARAMSALDAARATLHS